MPNKLMNEFDVIQHLGSHNGLSIEVVKIHQGSIVRVKQLDEATPYEWIEVASGSDHEEAIKNARATLLGLLRRLP